MVSKATAQNFLVLVLITNPTNTLLLVTKRKSGKCDYWCCMCAFARQMVETCQLHEYIRGTVLVPPVLMEET
jgi:hypothetical protein